MENTYICPLHGTFSDKEALRRHLELDHQVSLTSDEVEAQSKEVGKKKEGKVKAITNATPPPVFVDPPLSSKDTPEDSKLPQNAPKATLKPVSLVYSYIGYHKCGNTPITLLIDEDKTQKTVTSVAYCISCDEQIQSRKVAKL